MGCGKSTIGKELSRDKQLTLIDTDSLIESQEQRSISDIFASEGEEYFRQLETQTLECLLAQCPGNHIISTGGGIIMRPENREILQQLGFVVWLNATVDTLYQRICHCTGRPLLQTENPKATLTDIISNRLNHYKETADLCIDTDNLHIHEISFGILESAKLFIPRR